MNHNLILWPMVAMVGLTTAVWLRMYWFRLRYILRERIDPDRFRTRKGMIAGEFPSQAVWASDNLQNLFEMPVLFYAGVLTAYALGEASIWLIGLAWLYVGLRAVHSFVHVIYNRVTHRFFAYVASSLVLFVLWGAIAIRLALD